MSDAIAFLGLIPLVGVFTLAVGTGVCLIWPQTKKPKRYGMPFLITPKPMKLQAKDYDYKSYVKDVEACGYIEDSGVDIVEQTKKELCSKSHGNGGRYDNISPSADDGGRICDRSASTGMSDNFSE